MRGIETGGDSEMAYRRGYEHGVIELFYAIKRFLDPRTQEGGRAWIEKDVDAWRTRTMLGYPLEQRGGVAMHPPDRGSKRMRWRTCQRHVDKFDAYEDILDEGTFALMARLMGRG
jgi:hypothetical protein